MRPFLRAEQLPPRSRYNYKINAFGSLDAENEHTSMSLGNGVYGFNISINNGILTNGNGINTAEVNLEDGSNRVFPDLGAYVTGIKKPYLYRRYDAVNSMRDDRIVIFGTDRYIYQTSVYSGQYQRLEDVPRVAAGEVCFCNYCLNGADVLLILSDKGGMHVYDGADVTYYSAAPKLRSVCMHYERLFGADAVNPSRLHFSNDLEPTDWTIAPDGAGYIDFMDEGGAIIKVISFKDYIYIFREHSIVRLAAYADPSDYTVSKVFSTGSFIKAESIVYEDGKVFFMADSFLYSFDGYNAVRVFSGITELIADTSNTEACCFKNKLFIAAMLKTKDDSAGADEDQTNGTRYNNGFISIDLQTGGVSVFRGTSVKGFFPLIADRISELLVYFGNFRMGYFGKITDSGNLFGLPLTKVWESPESNLGSLDKIKALRRIYISSRYGLNIETAVDGQKRSSPIYGSDKSEKVALALVGDTAKLKLSTQNDKICVSSVTFEFDMIRRYNAN